MGKTIWDQVTDVVRGNLAGMLYGGAEMFDGFLSFASLGFYRGDIVRAQAAIDIKRCLGISVG